MEDSGVPTNHASAMAYSGRAESMDTADTNVNFHGRLKDSVVPHPPPPQHCHRGGYGYAPPMYPSSMRNPIKTCVTTSFEEREDRMTERRDTAATYHHDYGMRQHRGYSPPHHGSGREDFQGAESSSHQYYMERDHYHEERDPHVYARELPPIREGGMEERHPPHEMVRPPAREIRLPPSPPTESSYINRSFSNTSSIGSSYRGGPLKRSFWHHARHNSEDIHQSLPNEFMPPKRSKVTPPSGHKHREYVVTARTQSFAEDTERYAPPSRTPGWFGRAMSWEGSREDYYQRESSSRVPTGSWSSRSPPFSYRDERNGLHWGDAPSMPSPPGHYMPHFEPGYENSPNQMGRWHPADARGWGVQSREEAEETPRDGSGMHRQGHFEPPSPNMEPPMRFISATTPRRMGHRELMSDMLPMPSPELRSSGTLLLAVPEDRISLSETLCLVRENVEVFQATVEDVEAPAPGRKHPVGVGQVGLRCIHCRHATRSSDRVKRAICYPSSIKRIYRTVIDMKLDHFLHCKFVPKQLKETLNALKANNTRSTGTTMQYFIRAAGNIGLVDSPDGNGVRMADNKDFYRLSSAPLMSEAPRTTMMTPRLSAESAAAVATPDTKEGEKDDPDLPEQPIIRKDSISSIGSGPTAMAEDGGEPKEHFTGHIPMALPEDKTSLSPLRCFLREQVVAFSASMEDVAVRTPTTFSVTEGQVGIACIHCFNLPSKMRLNRAVCFPFSIGRIYQSVADIQRFHLADCSMAPLEVKEKFNRLQMESSKGSKGLATRQYWVTSAKKIGLVDTDKGIRFGRDPSIPEEKSPSLDILAQVASHVNSVNRPLVLPEDKLLVAEFLYTVIDQLQACRFTEADRNKRRLKNIGCIGVECKHCARQVDSRKFFWSSVNAVESNFVSVHTHVMECKKVPQELKDKLSELKMLRKEQTATLKSGSQKSFFTRVWERLNDQEKAAEAAAQEKLAELCKGDAGKTDGDKQQPPPGVVAVSESVVDETLKENMDETPAPSSPSQDKMEVSPTTPETTTTHTDGASSSSMQVASV